MYILCLLCNIKNYVIKIVKYFLLFNILKINGNLNFVFIVNCKKDYDLLKEINENLIKDFKIY